MPKTATYRMDGSLGEITNKLEDKIQTGGGVTLRERSFENLTNFIPRNDFLLESINGVQFQYLIKNEPNKMFNIYLQGWDAIIHIFQDKIITIFPTLENGKYFLDAIPKDILINVDAVSTCIEATQDQLIFNSITGVYFATANKPQNVPQGNPLFIKIEIPPELTGEKINSVKSDVYAVYLQKNLSNKIQGTEFDYNLSGIYIEDNPSFKIGDMISIKSVSTLAYFGNSFLNPLLATTGINIIAKIKSKCKGFVFYRNGYKMIFPSETLPPKPISNLGGTIFDIPEPRNIINLLYLEYQYELDPIILQYGSDIFRMPIRISSRVDTQKLIRYERHVTNITDAICVSSLGKSIENLSVGNATETQTFSPYTPYILGERLAVSNNNRILFSKVNDLKNFTTPNVNPTEADAFVRTIKDIREITFISSWGELPRAGFLVGSAQKTKFFSSIANIYTTEILPDGPSIPCSYITPKKIKINSIPANFIVENGRSKITAVIFTRDQQNYISLTDNVDFFDNDKIRKIESMQYGADQLLFVLTDNNKLYGCITGGEKLAWFRIELFYKIEDISVIDTETEKKLYIQSSFQNDSSVNAVGFIDFKENANKIKAEYFEDYLEQDNVFLEEKPELKTTENVVFKQNVSEDFKAKLPKPLIPKFTLHNQEIINNNVNTKAERRNRHIKNLALNVRYSNFFKIKFNEKEVYNVERINEDFSPSRIKELIKIYSSSPSSESVKISLEGNKNSTIPIIIQSISFDTEYGNPR